MGFETGIFTLSYFVPDAQEERERGRGMEGMGGAVRKGADWLLLCSSVCL